MDLAEAFKMCPICGARNQAKVRTCTNCGTSLTDVIPMSYSVQTRLPPAYTTPAYDFRYGETDLMENALRRPAAVFYAILMLLLTLLSLGVLLLALLPLVGVLLPAQSAQPTATGMLMVTVTPAPPTASLTPTLEIINTPTRTPSPTPEPSPTPCIQEVQPGDGLVAIVSRCGHRDLAVIDEVLEINGISDPAFIQPGQQIIVPWPTATPDPNMTPSETAEGSAAGGADPVLAVETDLFENAFAPTATATLQPGVMWHIVQRGDTIYGLAIQYGATARILSDLNPEITFSQCDFGEVGGGESCVVALAEGQYVRVPAPTPTPTLPPSPDPNATATPSATPTYNAPSLLRPGNNAPFSRETLVTLRWVTTATLGPGEFYRLIIRNETAGVIYNVETTQTEFTLPAEWQPTDGSIHSFTWQVSVVNNAGAETFTTETRTFTWESR